MSGVHYTRKAIRYFVVILPHKGFIPHVELKTRGSKIVPEDLVKPNGW
jgi:hypothetical protein